MLDETLSQRMQRLQVVSMKDAFDLALYSIETYPIDRAKRLIKDYVGHMENLEIALDRELESEKIIPFHVPLL